MLKGLGGLGDMAKIMKTGAGDADQDGRDAESLASITVTGESGAGLVKATATAKGRAYGADIDPVDLNQDEQGVSRISSLAVKDAQSRAQKKSPGEDGQLTEGMGLPPGMKLPF